jgi:hypothetical protein
MVAEPGAPHAQLRWVSQGILTGALNDNVHGATHYYDLSIIVGRGQRHDPERLRRYLLAVDLLLAPPASVGFQERDRVEEAQDLIHTLVMDIPPKWDNEVLPVARKGRLIFFKL